MVDIIARCHNNKIAVLNSKNSLQWRNETKNKKT